MMKEVTLYVLKGSSGKRYVGITNNLNRRFAEHRRKESKGGQVLGSEFILLHTEKFPDYNTAREREKYLKTGIGRKWLDEFDKSDAARREGG